MNMRIIVGTALVITLFLGLSPALAESARPGARNAFELLRQADTNGDGKVTYEELKAARPKLTPERFNRFDRNNDGAISKEDRKGPPPQGREAHNAAAGSKRQKLARLKEADTNGDGTITFEEANAAFPNLTEERYRSIDQNGDGVLNKEDLRQAAAEKFKQADTNGDGKVSLEEAQAALPRMTPEHFSRLDRNGDGFLTPEDRAR